MGDSGVKVRVELDPVEAAEFAELLADRKVQDKNLTGTGLLTSYLLTEAEETLALEKALRKEGYLTPGRMGSISGGSAPIRISQEDVNSQDVPDGSWDGPEGEGVFLITIGTLLLPPLRLAAKMEKAKRVKVGQDLPFSDLQGYAAMQVKDRFGKDHTALVKRRMNEESTEILKPAKKEEAKP